MWLGVLPDSHKCWEYWNTCAHSKAYVEKGERNYKEVGLEEASGRFCKPASVGGLLRECPGAQPQAKCLDHVEVLIRIKCSKPCVDSSKQTPNLQMELKFKKKSTLCEWWMSGGVEAPSFWVFRLQVSGWGLFWEGQCAKVSWTVDYQQKGL